MRSSRIVSMALSSLSLAGCGLLLDSDPTPSDANTADVAAPDAALPDAVSTDRLSVFVLQPSEDNCPEGSVHDAAEGGCLVDSPGSSPITVSVTLSEYTEVWARARGLQQESPDAFAPDGTTVDEVYVDGISITTGSPRRHLFTFAAGLNMPAMPTGRGNACPCDGGGPAPTFLAESWICETGNATEMYDFDELYSPDVLWDGDAMGGSSCTPIGDPSELYTTLDPPGTGPLEIRFLSDQGDDDYLVTELELWIR